MTEISPENKPEGWLKGFLDKLVDRMPALDEHKMPFLFISMFGAMAFGTLTTAPKEHGWIVYLTFISGMAAGIIFQVLRAFMRKGPPPDQK
jgi:hypothetical protein